MARNRNRNGQALMFSLNGRRANNAYGLEQLVGRYIGRVDVAKKRAAAGLVRRAGPAVSRNIRKEFNVKASQLRGKITAKDTGDSLRVYAFNRRIPLMAFSGKWGGRRTPGATASVLRGGGEVYQSAFIRNVNGLRSIRVRKRKGGGKRYGRGPLQMLYGPSPRDMIGGRRSDPENRNDRGFYPTRVREESVAELVQFYVAEIKRLMDVEQNRVR